MSGPRIPYADQVECVERELGYRRRVYPRRVEAGQMTAAQSTRELARMEAVLETVKAAAASERLF